MSHLAHTVALKKELIEKGIVDPKLQNDVVNGAYVRALVRYLFHCNALLGHYTEDVETAILDRLARWNEISPINGNYILARTKDVIFCLSQQAAKGGLFEPIPAEIPEKFNGPDSEVFMNLVNWLFGEMVTGND